MCARSLLRSGPAAEIIRGDAPRRREARQRALSFDPMPERIEPCLALLSSKAPTGPEWAYEVKWDGYRLAVHIGPGAKVRIITRSGNDWTSRFPTIAHDALELGVDSAILDGEAVVLDERGAADFSALQKALGGRGGKRAAAGAILYAFDLLYLNGQDLRSLPFGQRREQLGDVLDRARHSSLRFSEEVDAEGGAFLDLACKLGLEGIIAKNRDAPYRPGRGGDWLKIKCVQSETFVIVGYEPSVVALGGIGRLLLAARKGAELVYVGGVGTGFTQSSAIALRLLLGRLKVDRPAVTLKRKRVVWVSPELPAEIAFRGWTDDGMLRHASFKGIRDDADEASVYEMGQTNG